MIIFYKNNRFYLYIEEGFHDDPSLYGDNVIEKCGKGRDDTGDIGKRRNFNGKSEHFRRERPAFHK